MISADGQRNWDYPSLYKFIFLTAVLGGASLRLLAATLGDIGVYVDGALRISLAMKWAAKPVWMGLSGFWPSTHIYALGSLIRIWNEPVIIAKVIGVVCGIATIFVFRKAAQPRFGATAASWCALFLAFNWTHIWLSTAYWVEIPYLLFVLLAVLFAEKAAAAEKVWQAFAAGVFLTLAMLLRNEVLLLLGLFTLWLFVQTRKPKLSIALAVVPSLLMIWYFVEPALRGGSYFDYFRFVDRFKAMEMVVELISRRESLIQWGLMLGASPTLLIVVPGLYGLWKHRRRALTDLFAWMFVSQFAFHFILTITSGWRPQLRYLLLQFINLFPYAALVWVQVMRRFSPRHVIPLLMVSIIAIQSLGWWIGRNNRLPGGWLPLQVITSSQQKVDEFVLRINSGKLKLRSVIPGPRSDRWSLEHSFVVNRTSSGALDFAEVDVHVYSEVMDGVMPSLLFEGDVILIDPTATFYPPVIGALGQQQPNLVRKTLHPRVEVILFSDDAKKELADL